MSVQASVIARRTSALVRNVKLVPFVELFDGRVQGVVSSGSDIQRVYVSFVEARTGNFYCSTNNNRPCGGLRGAACKHIHSLVQEAVAQFGLVAVAGYLGLDPDDPDPDDPGLDARAAASEVLQRLRGTPQKESPGVVFSRFLNYLRYCELKAPPTSMLEMEWFVS